MRCTGSGRTVQVATVSVTTSDFAVALRGYDRGRWIGFSPSPARCRPLSSWSLRGYGMAQVDGIFGRVEAAMRSASAKITCIALPPIVRTRLIAGRHVRWPAGVARDAGISEKAPLRRAL